jgi:kynurenine formamidase
MLHQHIDLSHTIRDGMITYKGLPAPIICDYLSRKDSDPHYEEGTSFQIGKIEMVSNTGTYMDCPFHRYEDGKDLSQIHLKQVAYLEGILIEASYENGLAIDKSYFLGKVLKNKAVLVHTNWSTHWGTDQYFENHPFLTADAAEYLKEQKVALVGIDSHNIDFTGGNTRPVHSILLKNEILIVEHMTNLQALVGKTFSFSAVPPKVEDFGTFPVRAFATLIG